MDDSQSPEFRVRALGLACAILLFTGCADEHVTEVKETAQGLSESLEDLLCSGIDKLGMISQFQGLTTHCDPANTQQLHYQGGFVPSGGLGDLVKLPPLTNTIVECAVAHSEGIPASEGVRDTSVGRFGVETVLSVIDRQVTPQLYVEAERVGRIYLFGVPLALDVEDIRFNSYSENRAAGTIGAAHVFTGEPYSQDLDARTGMYLEVVSNNRNWDIGGSVKVPVGPIEVIISPGMSHKASYEGLRNQLVAPASAINPVFDFNTQLAAELNCIASCVPDTFCVCQPDPTPAQLSEHERLCNGGSCDYANLNDGVLPYDGALGGGTQTSLYDVPHTHWFHFGPTGTGGGLATGSLTSGAALGEPSYDLKKPGAPEQTAGVDPQNTQFKLHIDAGYSLGPATLAVGIQTNVDFRSSFALRQSFDNGPDRVRPDVILTTSLDSQSAVDVEVELLIDFGLFSFNPHYTIWNAATENTPKSLVNVAYGPKEDSGVNSFSVAGQSLDAGATLQQCLQNPTTLTPITPPSDPGEFFNEVGPTAIKNIHPCDARICPDGTKLTTCSWDSGALSLNCTDTQTQCGKCERGDNYVAMCGSDDKPLLDQNGEPVVMYLIPNERGCLR